MQKVCSATISAGVTKALTQTATPSSFYQGALAKLSAAVNITFDKLADVQRGQVEDWKKTLVTRETESEPEMCTEEALKTADKVVIGRGGSTQTSALLSCVKNYFSLAHIASTAAEPSRSKSDFTCSLAQACPYDQGSVALRRANKIWEKLVLLYNQRMHN